MVQKQTQAKTKKFSKAAFLDSAASSKERLEYEVVLKDDETYTVEQAKKLVDDWKNKKLDSKKEVK